MPCPALDGAGITADDLQAALSGVSLTDETCSELQLAIALGGSMLLTGRSGNGKSLVADRLGQMLVQSSEEIYVPYAIWLTDGILRIFDPQVHHPVDESDPAGECDARWRRIRRPVIKTSYELTRQTFDVTGLSNETWLAPFHVRANGGMLIVDDLGRQPVPLVDLLNRWQNALEFQTDPVTLPTGRRLNLPVDAWIVFVVGDDAPALPAPARRRIRSHVELPDPDRERFSTLLLEQGRRSRIEVDEAGVEELFTHCYSPQNPPKCSDPENLLQTVESLCRIQKETVRARADLLLAAASGWDWTRGEELPDLPQRFTPRGCHATPKLAHLTAAPLHSGDRLFFSGTAAGEQHAETRLGKPGSQRRLPPW